MSRSGFEDGLASRFREVLLRISAATGPARPQGEVTLVAVSKTQPVEAIEALYALGHRDFGENYAQELAEKARALASRCPEIRWHFIGHLQTNKAKSVIGHVACVHSVDSEKLARELAKRWKEAGRAGRLPVFIEVNLGGEASKSGVAPSSAPALSAAVAALPELSLEGLMCIPDPSSGPEGARAQFAHLRELEARCRPSTAGRLSMGMSADYEIALREGATHVRVGTALFGPR